MPRSRAPARLATVVVLGAVLSGCTAPGDRPTAAPERQPSVVLQAPSRVEPTVGNGSGITRLPFRAVLRDVTGDVYRVVRTPRSESRLARSPLDVTRTTVTHGAAEVRVTVTLAEVTGIGGTTVDLGLTTPAGRFFLDIDHSGTSRRLVDPSGDATRCTAVRSSAGGDTVRIAVPRSCLGDPDWVSVRVLLSRPTPDGELVENPHNSRSFSAYGTRRLYPL